MRDERHPFELWMLSPSGIWTISTLDLSPAASSEWARLQAERLQKATAGSVRGPLLGCWTGRGGRGSRPLENTICPSDPCVTTPRSGDPVCGVWSGQTIRDSPPVLGSETATQWYQGSDSWNISQLQVSQARLLRAQKQPRQNRKTLRLFWPLSDLYREFGSELTLHGPEPEYQIARSHWTSSKWGPKMS